MMAGIYSFLSALLFTTLDAVDVAFTEASVGAGISTVLMLGALALVGKDCKPRTRPAILPLFVVVVTGLVLVYGTMDMPPFGNPDNPIHHHVAPRYIEDSFEETGVPNIVTSVLASYRGYDTMGETTVIFTAVVGVLLLLARGRKASGAEPGGARAIREAAGGATGGAGPVGSAPGGGPPSGGTPGRGPAGTAPGAPRQREREEEGGPSDE